MAETQRQAEERKRDSSGVLHPVLAGKAKPQAGTWEWCILIDQLGGIFGFLCLVLSWKEERELEKLTLVAEP